MSKERQKKDPPSISRVSLNSEQPKTAHPKYEKNIGSQPAVATLEFVVHLSAESLAHSWTILIRSYWHQKQALDPQSRRKHRSIPQRSWLFYHMWVS